MRKPLFARLFALYLAAAGALGAWRAGGLWAGWPVWCLLLPPLAWWGFGALDWWRRGGPVRVSVVVGLVAFVLLSAAGLGVAWVVAEWVDNSRTLRQLPPAARALVGAAVGAAVGGVSWLYQRSQKAVEQAQAGSPDDNVGPVAPDGGGRVAHPGSSPPRPPGG
jgi:hypothetical protein